VGDTEIEIAKANDLFDVIERTTHLTEVIVDDETIYHEAGHAVAVVACGRAVERVTTVPPQVRIANILDEPLTFDVQLIVSMSGEVAQNWRHRLVRRQFDEDLLHYLASARADGHRCDECRCMRRILRHYPDATDAQVMAVWRQHDVIAIDLIKANWGYVRAVAEALKEHGTLTGDDVNDIVDNSLVRYIPK
jgi:hypothetical protein